MPYTKDKYPQSMKNLSAEIRGKAIEILNKLLEEKNMDEGMAIAVATSRAKDWAANRGKKVPSSSTDKKAHGEDIYVFFQENGWAMKKEKADRASKVFDTKMEAVSNARSRARKNNLNLIIKRKDGKIQKKISFNR